MARLREQLWSIGGAAIAVVWLLISIYIATSVFGFEARRRHLWAVLLIFASPLPVILVLEEAIHRIRHGPTKPGRHSRT